MVGSFRMGSSLAVIGMALAPAIAEAQTTPQESVEAPTRLEDIVVTARKREESAQSVPISVTVFSGAALQAQSAVKLSDVRGQTPNLFIGQGGAAPAGPIIGIRGQAQNDTVATLDPSVGIYVDGIYWARAQGANGDLLDIERVEVLKGPQGTLFGRNTTGGALNLTTANPDLTRVSGSVQARIGNFSQRDGTAILNLPLVTDKLGIRLAANRVKNDGFFRNLTTGHRRGEQDSYTLRGKLLAEPTDNFRILLSYEHFGLDQAGTISRLLYSSPFPSGIEIVALLSTGGCLRSIVPTCPAPVVPGSQTVAQYQGAGGFYGAFNDAENTDRVNTDTASLTAEWTLPFATLKYIGGYREVDADTGRFDYDGTPFSLLAPRIVNDVHQWSHELQLNGDILDNRVNYTLGGYLFRESGLDMANTFALRLINPNNPTNVNGRILNRSWAVFGQATWRLTDRLSFTGGLRYSDDRKQLDLEARSAGVCALRVGDPPALLPAGTPCLISQSRKDTAVSYTASLDYKIADDILVYAKTSKGYRAGGFNLRGTTPSTYGPFSPETVVDYEIGLKSEFLDRRVRFNIAAFYSDYSDIQRSVLVANGTGGVATTVVNAAKARITGIEAELTTQPVEGLMLSGAIGVIDPKYKSYQSICPTPFPTTSAVPCVNGLFDRSKESFERIPEVNWSLSGSYTHDLPVGSFTIRADYSYTGKIVQQGLTQTLTPALTSFNTQRGYGLLNGRLSWNIWNPDLTLALYGRNITKKKYYAFQIDLVNAGLGYIFGNPGTPRQYGAEATLRF